MPVMMIDLECIFRTEGDPFEKALDGIKYYEQTHTVLLYSKILLPLRVTQLFALVDQKLGSNPEGISRCADVVICEDPRRVKYDRFITTPQTYQQIESSLICLHSQREIEAHWNHLALMNRKSKVISRAQNAPNIQTLLVDMDGVLYAFFEYILKMFKEKHPEIPVPVIKNHMLQENFPPEARPYIDDLFKEPRLFEQLPLIAGCKEGLKMLNRHFELCVCSMPYFASAPRYNTAEQKIISLQRDGLMPFFRDTIYCSRKHWVDATGIIEDSPRMIVHHDEQQFKVILYTQKYNEHIPTPYRLNNWGEVEMLGLLRKLGKVN